ncbi:zf-HC2 domain-containing protein [Streptomyces sp. NPDC047097]|uniref:zf-HC2 domain-containing protein n=1 Tax=Streptomyces sp. NPDC047097 TaxID=3155260 RepID=UPI0033D2DE33
MSGTGPTPADDHLGDRLAALVDGELGHDTRERCLAHLATCARCKAEADAQRRLKSVFAQAAPPPPSAGLLARLQGLPGGAPGDDGGPPGPFGGPPGPLGRRRSPFATDRADGGGYGMSPGPLEYAAASALPGGRGEGFPIHEIHEVARREAERSPWRGRRFALTAASAVSFAAIALGGALPAAAPVDVRGEGTGSNVTPVRSPGQQQGSDPGRRRGSGPAPAERPAPPTGVPARAVQQPAAPLRTGAPPFLTATHPGAGTGVLNAPVAPPLVRPAGQGPYLAAVSGPGPARSAAQDASSVSRPSTGRR